MNEDRYQVYLGKSLEELNLSCGSSKKLLATCPKCGHKWKVFVKYLNKSKEPCEVCRRFGTSVWNQEYSNLLEEYLVDKSLIEDHSISPSSGKLIDVECKDCSTISRRTVSSIVKDLINKSTPCKECDPQYRIRGGKLFFANHPELLEYKISKDKEDVFEQTLSSMEMRCSKCGSLFSDRPMFIISHNCMCKECLDVKKSDNFNKLSEHISSLGGKLFKDSENYSKVLIECTECKTSTEMKLSHFNNFINKGGDIYSYKCAECYKGKYGKFRGSFLKYAKDYKNITFDEEECKNISAGSAKIISGTCTEGHITSKAAYTFKDSCTICNQSSGEEEIAAFLTKKNIPFKQRDRKILSNKELDFVIEKYKIAIEYNGLYWHSTTRGKGKCYHYNKWKEAKDNGYELIVVWEDDWINNKNLVKSMILNACKNRRSHKPIEIISEVNQNEAEEFFKKNSLRRFVKGDVYSAHYDSKSSLQGISVWKRQGNFLSLVEYAMKSNKKITTDIIEQHMNFAIDKFINNSIHVSKIEVTIPNGYGNNSLGMNDLGFMQQQTKINHFHFIKNSMMKIHDIDYSFFKDNPDFVFKSDTSLKELIKINKVLTIYDAGNIIWEKNI